MIPVSSSRRSTPRIGAASKLEVRMNASLLRRNPSSRIVDKHGVQEIYPIVLKSGDQRLGEVPLPLGERALEIRK